LDHHGRQRFATTGSTEALLDFATISLVIIVVFVICGGVASKILSSGWWIILSSVLVLSFLFGLFRKIDIELRGVAGLGFCPSLASGCFKSG
jgi:ABC-type multidrug transport system permease subunit